MNRITEKQLHSLARAVNQELGAPLEPWKDFAALRANVGHYGIEAGNASNAWNLVRITNERGGETQVLTARTKSELYELMHAFLAGVREERRTNGGGA